jgi:GNAT superfamily N-acetyltransferase
LEKQGFGQMMTQDQFTHRLADRGDIEAIVQLVNGAYRGESGTRGWTTEARLIGGQRVDHESIQTILDFPAEESGLLLLLSPQDPARLLGCVHLKKVSSNLGYLGMLTIEVSAQSRGAGTALIHLAEDFAHSVLGVKSLEMTVLAQRPELIAWYVRKGYVLTGENRPFPYGDERFGIPFGPGLYFEVLQKLLFQSNQIAVR